jgi:hypothetical protein
MMLAATSEGLSFRAMGRFLSRRLYHP